MRTHEVAQSEICCPPFDPRPWDDQEVTWAAKPFAKIHLRAFFHVPIHMGAAITRLKKIIDAAGAEPPQPLMLYEDRGPWGVDLYVAVSDDVVPGAAITSISGTFLTKVFEGPYKEMPRWMDAMKALVAARGRTLAKLYTAFTVCPACAAAYGHNYVVMLAKVD